MTNEQIAAEIAKNNTGEQEALDGYFRLIDFMKYAGVNQKYINDIAEIISDEMNHTEKLNAMMTEFSSIRPAID